MFAVLLFYCVRLLGKVTVLGVISTEGALRLPTTYDNHPTYATQSHPIHPHIAVKTTSPLKI